MLSYIKKIFPEKYDICDFDGKFFIEKNYVLSPIDNLECINGAKKILTDFNNQAFARLIYTDSEPKYAELLAKKKINDSGEFDNSIDLHVHKKQKVGDLTKIYCTPISAEVLEHYKNIVSSDSDGVILSGVHDALWALMKKNRTGKPIVLIFNYMKSYEILIASSKQIYFAGRFNAFEYDVASIESIWEVINVEVKKIQTELSEQIKDAYLYHADIEKEYLDVVFRKISELSINLHIPKSPVSQRKHNIDLLMNNLNIADSIGDLLDKLYYFFQKNFAYINIAVIFISLSIFSLSAYVKWHAKSLNEQIVNNTAAINEFKMPVISIPDKLTENISFYEKIRKTALNKQISTIFSDLSAASSDYVTINKLNFIENQSINSIEVDGTIVSSFDESYQSYKKMIAALKGDGYTVDKENFSTDINESKFSFILEYASL